MTAPSPLLPDPVGEGGFTPGPWYVRDFRASEMRRLGWPGPSMDRILITNKTGAEIEASSGADCVVARIQFDNRTDELSEGNLADARLIAAAPALFAALKTCRCPAGGWNGMPADIEPTIANCMAAGACGCDCGGAIRKATGGSQ